MSSSPDEILVVDYGMGNLRNVARAIERAGGRARVTRDPDALRRADRLVVPGVGACGDAMQKLHAAGLVQAIREYVRSGRMFLGICIGMQLLLETAEEGDCDCLGLIPGRVAAFPEDIQLAVPHMGWNLVKPETEHPVIREGYFYFVHGYRANQVPSEYWLARTSYGEEFPSAIGFRNCVGVQFHPEKSQHEGVALLERFCEWSV